MNDSNLVRISLSCLLTMMMLTTAFGQQKPTDDNVYQVVVNHEEQYSILLQNQRIPEGWKTIGKKGKREDCQTYIEKVWTDMRPLSIRQMNLAAKADYQVVINHEEQYSIWPKGKKVPQGWKAIGVSGNRNRCQTHIQEVWTDMRPLSLRKKLDR